MAASAALVELAANDTKASTRFSRRSYRCRVTYLNGYQEHFTLVGGQESARSTVHLADIFRLADKASLRDSGLAIERMRTVPAARGVA